MATLIKENNETRSMKKRIFTTFSAILALTSALIFRQMTALGESEKPVFNSVEQYRSVVDSPGGLLAYTTNIAQTIEGLASDLDSGDEVFSTITFSEPLSPSKVQQIIDSYSIYVQTTHIRTVEPNGLRGTLFVNTAATNKIFDEEILSQIEESSGASFVGIIELVADVPVSQLLPLNSNDAIYLVDPSADSNLVDNPTEDYMPGLFWELESESLAPNLNLGI